MPVVVKILLLPVLDDPHGIVEKGVHGIATLSTLLQKYHDCLLDFPAQTNEEVQFHTFFAVPHFLREFFVFTGEVRLALTRESPHQEDSKHRHPKCHAVLPILR